MREIIEVVLFRHDSIVLKSIHLMYACYRNLITVDVYRTIFHFSSTLPEEKYSEAARRRTFKNWPKKHIVSAKELAANGFIFIGMMMMWIL